jgi:hypothetical protein
MWPIEQTICSCLELKKEMCQEHVDSSFVYLYSLNDETPITYFLEFLKSTR